jgi:hypothetical protein
MKHYGLKGGRMAWAAGGAAVAAGLAVAMTASPAAAKENLSLSVTPHSVRAGQVVRVVASGGSDAGQVEQLCLDMRFGHQRWQTAHCVSDYLGAGGPLTGTYRLRHAGTEGFRAQLLVKQGRGYHVDLTSAAVTVRVAG